ncbi:MAG: hypothetical protein Q8K65_00465 [Alphaproteobacteria bacterium]|nr:hypothetical protein [Alphaproteobacteria bacterium]
MSGQHGIGGAAIGSAQQPVAQAGMAARFIPAARLSAAGHARQNIRAAFAVQKMLAAQRIDKQPIAARFTGIHRFTARIAI